MPAANKLLIVDQSLRDWDGHYFEYVSSIASAARDHGLEPIIGTNFRCGLDISDGRLIRHFSHAWNESHHASSVRLARRMIAVLPAPLQQPTLRLASTLRRATTRRAAVARVQPPHVSFGVELANLVRQAGLGPNDHVFVHTISVAELHSVIAAGDSGASLPWHHFMLRRDAEEPLVAMDPWGGISAAMRAIASRPALARTYRFYADTEDLVAQYEALSCGVPVRLLPIPHGLDASAAAPRQRRDGPLRITYLGNARTEKGFQNLPDVVAALQASHMKTGRVRFVIQANSSMSLEDAIISDARRRLAAMPAEQVELLQHALSPSEFQARLCDADLLLLCYDAEKYRRRSSGVLVQAIAVGCPVVVPADTWMARTAPAGAAVTFDGFGDLRRACSAAIDRLPELGDAACRAAPEWRAFHNPGMVVMQLLSRDA